MSADERQTGGRTNQPLRAAGGGTVGAGGTGRAARGRLRRRDVGHARDTAFGPSMTPMVDVTLVILIFFMASTAFVGPEWLLRTALPRERREGEGAAGAAVFTLPPARFDVVMRAGAGGATVVTGLGVEDGTVEEVAARIGEYAARLGADRLSVFIAPDAGVAYRDVVRLHEACAAAGIENVGVR